jgi:tetratricopeptide (TPR) repeat protein
MKSLTQTIHSDFPDRPATPDAEPDASPVDTGSHGWLKHLALYLSAVLAAGLVGLFFFWQLPLPDDLTSLVDEPSGVPRYRSTPASLVPIATVTPEPPASTDAASEPSLDSTETATAALSATESADDPNARTPEDLAEEIADLLAETSGEEPLTPNPQEDIAQLLVEAQQHMDNRRITAPAHNNALLAYQRVLELQPGHPGAVEGIQRIGAYYWDVAEQRYRQGRFDEGLTYINRGLRASPDNRALLNLRREIQLTQQRQQEELALRLEMERQWAIERARQEQIRRERQAQQQPLWQQQAPSGGFQHGFNQR